jgi:Protein of unknown function (DUF1580)
MIDIKHETLITLSEAAKFVPRRRRGRKVSISTIYRWASPAGHRGVRLEALRVGGSLCTSVEALQRFFNRLTIDNVAPRKETGTESHIQASVARELAEYGV